MLPAFGMTVLSLVTETFSAAAVIFITASFSPQEMPVIFSFMFEHEITENPKTAKKTALKNLFIFFSRNKVN